MRFDETIIPLMESRTGFYRMLHMLYRRALTQDELDALDAAEFQRLAADPTCAPLMADGFNDMYRFLRRRNTGTRQTLSADFTKVFLGTSTYNGLTAQPFASLFLGGEGRLMGAPRTAAYNTYKRHQVRLSHGVDLPEDHLAFECEFLAILNERATEKLRANDADGAAELLDAERQFLEEQVLTWLNRFYALSLKMIDTRFYRGVVKMTKSYLQDDPETIGFLIEDLRDLTAAGE